MPTNWKRQISLVCSVQLFHKVTNSEEALITISCAWCFGCSFYEILRWLKSNACDLASVSSCICTKVGIFVPSFPYSVCILILFLSSCPSSSTEERKTCISFLWLWLLRSFNREKDQCNYRKIPLLVPDISYINVILPTLELYLPQHCLFMFAPCVFKCRYKTELTKEDKANLNTLVERQRHKLVRWWAIFW